MNKENTFIGKFCSIITLGMNRDFKEENQSVYPNQIYQYFSGIVEVFDENIVLIKDVKTGTRTVFNFKNVICVSEEVMTLKQAEVEEMKSGMVKLKEKESIVTDSSLATSIDDLIKISKL